MAQVVRYRYGLDETGQLLFEGHITGGRLTRQQWLAEHHGTTCVECNQTSSAGVFAVGGEGGIGSPDFVNFTCRGCIEDLYGDEYDFSDTRHE